MTLENYDPNLTSAGRRATQTVELTFKQWQYSATATVEVGGNCMGLSIIESALESAYDKLPTTSWDAAYIVMTDSEGNELTVEDLDERDYDWLNAMLVKAEITSIVPSDD